MIGFDPAALKQKARSAAQRALYEAGEKVARESWKAAPRDTGRLAESVYVKTNSLAENVSCEVGFAEEYARYVHDGSSDNAGFLRKPFIKLQNDCKRMIQKAVKEAVR